MTTYRNPTWELSQAHDTYYHERRSYVAEQLHRWGSTSNTTWPEAARFVSLADVVMQPGWFGQIVQIGKAGVCLTIAGWKLAALFPTRGWDQADHDVYFIEVTQGNVDKGAHSHTLMAYVVGATYVRVITLGCGHPNAELVRASGQFREFRCPDCTYTYGVDTSD